MDAFCLMPPPCSPLTFTIPPQDPARVRQAEKTCACLPCLEMMKEIMVTYCQNWCSYSLSCKFLREKQVCVECSFAFHCFLCFLCFLECLTLDPLAPAQLLIFSADFSKVNSGAPLSNGFGTCERQCLWQRPINKPCKHV